MGKKKKATTKVSTRKYMISRNDYLYIKRLNHVGFEDWLINWANSYASTLKDSYVDENKEVFDEASKIYSVCIMEALENTKGIGEKIKNAFVENYNKSIDEHIKDSKILISDNV